MPLSALSLVALGLERQQRGELDVPLDADAVVAHLVARVEPR